MGVSRSGSPDEWGRRPWPRDKLLDRAEPAIDFPDVSSGSFPPLLSSTRIHQAANSFVVGTLRTLVGPNQIDKSEPGDTVHLVHPLNPREVPLLDSQLQCFLAVSSEAATSAIGDVPRVSITKPIKTQDFELLSAKAGYAAIAQLPATAVSASPHGTCGGHVCFSAEQLCSSLR